MRAVGLYRYLPIDHPESLLDLEVETNGQLYRGNHFTRDLSIPGGPPDTRNNVEGVWLPDKIESSSTIRVVGDVLLQIEYVYDSVKVENVSNNLTTRRN